MELHGEVEITTGGKRGRVSFPEHAGLVDIIGGVDTLFGDGDGFTLIKDGTATTVGVIKGQRLGLDLDLLVKRFNYKGPLHSMARRFTGSRAEEVYAISLKLFKMGQAVPEPLGFVEAADRRTSFFISRYVPGTENLALLYKEGYFKDPPGTAQRLAKALAGWHAAGAVHGDLKWSNILLSREDPGEIFFIDLDQAALSTEPSPGGMREDLVRFYRYGLTLGSREWMDGEFFPAYLGSLAPGLRSQLDVEAIRGAARREFEKREKART